MNVYGYVDSHNGVAPSTLNDVYYAYGNIGVVNPSLMEVQQFLNSIDINYDIQTIEKASSTIDELEQQYCNS